MPHAAMAQISDAQLARSADADDGEEVPALLIIGSDAAHRSDFVSRLHATSAAAAGSTDAGFKRSLMLDTKYYTASVDIYDVAPESAAQHPAAATAEGVILLLSRHDVGSFDAARNALQSADTSAEIQLCVCDRAAPPAGDGASASLPADAAQSAACAAAQEWAAAQLFEYIEVDTADAAADVALQLDGELQGMQRVLGALEAHMWPGLHMKPQLSGQGSGGRDSVLAAAATAGDRHSGQHGSQQSASSQLPISTAGPAGHATLNPKGTDAGAGATAGADQLPGGADVGEPFGAFLSGEDADSDDEADRKFAKLMGQLAGTRERLRDLPDAERRAGAEQMALQMVQLLGVDDSDAETDDATDAGPQDSQQPPLAS